MSYNLVNQLTSYGGSSSPQHDNNGNYTSPTGYGTLVWDAENRLVQAGTGSSQTKFSYDGLSRRRSATSYNNGSITNNVNYLWCDDSLCQKRQANSTSVMANYVSEGESYPNWLNAYYAVDHLGTPRDILNVATGQTLRAGDYTPFGGAEASAVNGLYSTEFGFAGMQVFPFTSGNVDYLTKYRLYKPGFGRWLSRDPIAEQGGINLYGYVEGNPVNWVDPLGLDFYCELCHGNNSIPRKVLDLYNPDPMEMAKGGKTNIDNEYVRDVQAKGKDCDPCEYLRGLYRDERDSVERGKIKKAMKRFNCDGKDRFQ
jgi:RHS repeat-associated protein